MPQPTFARRAPARFGLLAALVILTACSSKADRIESGLLKGGQFVAQGDLDKASVEVRNVLQIDPKVAQAYLIAGQIDDARMAFRGAYVNYSKALELQPDLREAQLSLARIYLLAGEVDNAEKQLRPVLAADPDNLRAKVLEIAMTARRGDQAAALRSAAQLVASKPALTPESAMLLAGLQVNAKDFDAALAILDQSIAADAGKPHRNVQLLQMAAEVAGMSPVSGEAAAQRAVGYYRTATSVAPKEDAMWRAWAALHVSRQQLDEAEAVLRASIKAAPDSLPRQYALLEFMAAHRGLEATERAFTEAIAAQPKRTELRFARIEYDRSQNRLVEVRMGLDEIVAMGADAPAGLQARGQIAALHLAEGDVDEARRVLDEVIRVNPRDSAGLLLRGRILLAEGKARDAANDLRAAAKDRPGAPEVVAALAMAHHAAGEPLLAREVIGDAVKAAPGDAVLRLLLADDLTRAGDGKAALIEVNEILRTAPQNARARQMRAMLLLSQGQPAEAEKAAQALIDAVPRNPLGPMTLGRILATQKKLDAALKQYDTAARLAPEASEPVLSAVALLIGQKRWADAAARIDALEKDRPASRMSQQLRGEWALAKGDLALAEQSFQALTALPRATPESFRNLAAVRFARKDTAGTLAALEAGEQAHPKDISLPSARAEWLLRLKRIDEAIALYEQLLKRSPDNDAVVNNLAYTLAEAKGDPASLQRALTMASRFETSN